MKIILTTIVLLVFSPFLRGGIEKNSETITQSNPEKTPVSRTITVKKDDVLLYRSFEPLDPQLIGIAMPPLKESFYIDGNLIFTIFHFPKDPKFEFHSFKDYSVRFISGDLSSLEAASPSNSFSLYLDSKFRRILE